MTDAIAMITSTVVVSSSPNDACIHRIIAAARGWPMIGTSEGRL
jgi:hypothetical protein